MPPIPLEFTGERFVPGDADGEIAYEHWHRYALARHFASGRRVLDAACGEGYGTALIARSASEAIGIDIDAAAIAHAQANYGGRLRVRYQEGSVTALPLADASVDVVISFETIEHISEADQPRMLAEFARVLVPEGVLLLSSPNKRKYSDERAYRNPFHLHELYRVDLERLLDASFPCRRWFHQTRVYASAVWSEDLTLDAKIYEAWTGDGDTVVPAAIPDGLYHIVLGASSASALPAPNAQLSLFADRGESELKRIEAQVKEILRLDALLADRDAAADRQMAHIRHLEELVAYRERIVEERDAQLVDVNAAREANERGVIEAQSMLGEARASLAQCEAELAAVREAIDQMEQEKREHEAALAAPDRAIADARDAPSPLALPQRLKLLWHHVRGR